MSIKVVSENKKAYHDYFILEKYEAGLALLGTEIKSIRQGKGQLKDSYISFSKNEAYVKGMHIAHYKEGNRFNHDEARDRKLLLHKSEIIKLQNKVKLSGLTIIPLRLYLSCGRAKLEIALCRGKDLYDKRQDAKIKSMEREAQRSMRF